MEHEVSPLIPDLKVPRANPCGALNMDEDICGATPTSLYRRVCSTPSHAREIWLCGVHAAIVACGGATCHDCAIRGGASQARIIRLDINPLRLGLWLMPS